jgi:copper chaperone CopZ
MNNVSFEIQDMSCGHCVRHVTEALRRLADVEVRRVAVGSADVSFDPAKTTPAAIAEAIGAAGYPAKERAAAADRLASRAQPGGTGGWVLWVSC